MRSFSIVAVAAAVLVSSLNAAHAQPATLIRDGVGVTDPAVAASLPRYLQSRSARFVDWLSDGSMLVATRFGDTRQIHRVRAPLSMREQLSFAPAGIIGAAARPYSSDTFAYLTPMPGTPMPGGGRTQLFLQQLGEHAPRALTDGSYHDGVPIWAPDGKRLAFTSNRRNGADVDVYVLDLNTPGTVPRLVVGSNGARWRIYDWSGDGHRLLLGRELAVAAGVEPGDAFGHAAPETELYLADLDSGALTPIEGPAVAGPSASQRHSRKSQTSQSSAASRPLHATAARFAGDGRGIVLLTRELPAAGESSLAGREFLHLSYTDPSDGQWRELSAPISHDVELFDQSADGRYLAYTLNDAGLSRLMLIDQQLKLEVTVAALPPGIISGLKFDGSSKRLALTLETTRSPPDVYVFEPGSAELTRWTESEVGPLDTQSFVVPQLLYFPTWDRVDGQPRQLSTFVYSPGAGATGGAEPRPVVIWLCSGDRAPCRPGYAPFVQYLARELGFVVIAPNVRGSSGLGLSLQLAGKDARRDDAVRDIGSLLAWIGLQPGLDRGRVALLGEGYGSYLALASLAQYGDRIEGAVAAFPSRLNGLTNVLAIRRPVLLVQGLGNAAVPAYEAAQLREGLRAQGVAVQYLAAAGEAQDFNHKSSRDAYRSATASFLARLLR